MGKSIEITEQEHKALLDLHTKDVLEADRHIALWNAKKSLSLARIEELNGNKSNLKKETPTAVNEDKPITFRSKMYKALGEIGKDASSGDIYRSLINIYPEEAQKNKLYHLQTIGKTLQKDSMNNEYIYLSKVTNEQGRAMYGLLEWLKIK